VLAGGCNSLNQMLKIGFLWFDDEQIRKLLSGFFVFCKLITIWDCQTQEIKEECARPRRGALWGWC
jgi:hypothetical protein